MRHVSSFFETQRSFVQALKSLIEKRLLNEKREDVNAWVDEIFLKLENKKIRDILERAAKSRKTIFFHAMAGLELEMKVVTKTINHAYENCDESSTTVKRAIKGGGVVLGSLKELLGNFAPPWLKAALVLGKEMTDIVSVLKVR